MNAFEILWQYRDAFAKGFLTTGELVVYSIAIGTGVGISLEFLSERFERPTRYILDIAAFGLSAIPALVVLFWLYYPAQTLLGVSIDPFWTALAALALMNTFAVYRIVADAVDEFPTQYIATGLVSGLTNTQIARFIKFPLLLRATLPRWIDQQVVILQTSVFASLISVDEVFRAAQRINSVVYQPVIIYTAMAILFLITAGTAMYGAKYFRKKFHRDFSER